MRGSKSAPLIVVRTKAIGMLLIDKVIDIW